MIFSYHLLHNGENGCEYLGAFFRNRARSLANQVVGIISAKCPLFTDSSSASQTDKHKSNLSSRAFTAQRSLKIREISLSLTQTREPRT